MGWRDGSIAGQIAGLLKNELFIDPAEGEIDLVEGGLIDSAAFMRLFAVLERDFGIEIRYGDLDLEHFRTIERMAAFVLEKQKKIDR